MRGEVKETRAATAREAAIGITLWRFTAFGVTRRRHGKNRGARMVCRTKSRCDGRMYDVGKATVHATRTNQPHAEGLAAPMREGMLFLAA